MTFREFVVKYIEEGVADVCGDVFTVQRVVPVDVSLSFLILGSTRYIS